MTGMQHDCAVVLSCWLDLASNVIVFCGPASIALWLI